MFEKFKGIKAEREIKEEQKSRVEKLLEIGDRVIEENKTPGPMIERHKIICAELKNDALRGFEFDEKDLETFVYAVHTRDYSGTGKIMRGAYTGCLLELLTERNKEEGKRTRVHIDGKGMSFPYLFLLAGEVDELIVENLKGIQICNYLGHSQGSINLALGKNIEGENTFASIGSEGMRTGIVACTGIKGDGTLYNVGKKGATDLVLGHGIEGNKALSEVGKWGTAGVVIGNDINGDWSFGETGNSGRIGVIMGTKLRGKYAFNGQEGQIGFWGQIGLVLAKDIQQKNSAFSRFNAEAKAVLYEKIKGDNPFASYAKRKICAEKSRDEYDRLVKEYRLDEILELSELTGKSAEEIAQAAYKIREIYKSIEGKLENVR